MPAPIHIAILGFSAFERNALATYFRASTPGLARFDCVLGVDDAQFVIADADQPGVVQLLQTLGRTNDAVFIGAQAPAEAAAWMMRPIDKAHVLRELDALLSQRDNPRSSPLPLTLPGSLPPALGRGALRTIGDAALADLPARRIGDAGAHGPHGPGGPSGPHGPGGRLPAVPSSLNEDEIRHLQRQALRQPQIEPRALLVDDSEIALQYLRRQLDGCGLAIDMARHSDRALDLLKHHAYGIVFLDIDLGDKSRVDGLTLCHIIRHGLMHPAGRPPLVVMVSAFNGPVDQVRATLAGAEACLGKPPDLLVLDRLLQRQGIYRQAGHRPPQPQATPPRPA